MEKIYMEESKKQKKSVMNFSVVLSFVVAIFAVFSLGAFGIVTNQGTGVSYAAVTGDSFTLSAVPVSSSNESGQMYGFEFYYSGTASIQNQIFCIERNLNVEPNQGYSRESSIRPTGQTGLVNTDGQGITITNSPDITSDYGLMRLLAIGQSESQRKEISEDDTVSGFVVQSAIWKYLATKYQNAEAFKLFTKNTDTGEYNDLAVMNSDIVTINGTRRDGISIKSLIDNLVAEANAATLPRLSVTKADDEVSKTEDGKYYQSALITVTGNPSDQFSSYDVTLTVPKSLDGVVIVDESGTVVESTSGSATDAEKTMNFGTLAAGKKFYVRVPVDKVNEEVQKIKVSVSGKFENAGLYFYKTADDKLQRMASVVPGYVDGGVEVEFVGSPDTGMNAAQTIYFIGLIVLLCGVGIVYANAKPVEAKQ